MQGCGDLDSHGNGLKLRAVRDDDVNAFAFFIFENGITSLNFARRQDLLNGRTTRTTHPKTIHLLQRLFSEIVGAAIMDFRELPLTGC